MPVNTADLSPLGGGNDGLTTEAHISSVGRLSLQTTGQSISPAITFESDRSLGWYKSAASTMAASYGTVSLPGTLSVASLSVTGNTSAVTTTQTGAEYVPSGSSIAPSFAFSSEQSLGFYRSSASSIALTYGTLDLFIGNCNISMKTQGANPSGFTIGQWGFVFNASGLSIFYSSGKSIYFFGGSTLSAVQS